MQSIGANNKGLQKRREYILNSREAELLGRVHDSCYLLNGVDVKLRLVRSKDAFPLMADGADSGFKVKLLETSLHVRKAKLNPSVQLGHIKALPEGTAKYRCDELTARCSPSRKEPCLIVTRAQFHEVV